MRARYPHYSEWRRSPVDEYTPGRRLRYWLLTLKPREGMLFCQRQFPMAMSNFHRSIEQLNRIAEDHGEPQRYRAYRVKSRHYGVYRYQ